MEQSETFEKIADGVNALFDRMKCDRSLVTRSLGKSTEVDAENILDFLLCVENQSNFLIRVYLASQEDAGKVPIFVLELRSGLEKPSSPAKTRKSTASRASVTSSEYHDTDYKDKNGRTLKNSKFKLR